MSSLKISQLKISDLYPSGYAFFEDKESFLVELCVHAMTPLEYRELEMLQGGMIISQVTYSQGLIGDAVQPSVVQPTNNSIATLQPQSKVFDTFDSFI
jgi:hypothetical protein